MMEIQETLAAGLRIQIEQPPIMQVEAPRHTQPADLPPEQIEAVEAVFSESSAESELAAGLLGMWTGTLVLHDVLKDTLTSAKDEELEEKKKKRRPDPDPE
jgi:hypothetical protein